MSSLVSTREKRNNAGNRMSKLLNEEDEDEFYKTTYGGFSEASISAVFSFVVKPYSHPCVSLGS